MSPIENGKREAAVQPFGIRFLEVPTKGELLAANGGMRYRRSAPGKGPAMPPLHSMDIIATPVLGGGGLTGGQHLAT
jgi:hypothetical protein